MMTLNAIKVGQKQLGQSGWKFLDKILLFELKYVGWVLGNNVQITVSFEP